MFCYGNNEQCGSDVYPETHGTMEQAGFNDFSTMDIAQITQYGSGQSVALPSGFQFNTDEVCISRFGEAVVLYPKEVARNKVLQSLSEFTSDFMETREQPESVEERDWT